jgi:regulator of sigma E protease
MTEFLFTIVAFIVAISVLVAIHEYGHYIVGRWTGMKVLRFSIGIGNPVWSRRAGPDDTEYCISALPLGGYVRFLDTREGPIEPEDEGRAFNQRPIPARIAVLLAGPLFNFIFAVFAYWALFVYGVPTVTAAVGPVAPGSYAAEAGLETGDRIVSVGDVETLHWEAALVQMLSRMVSDGRIPLTLEDERGRQRQAVIDVGSERTRLTEPGVLFDGLGFQPWSMNDMSSVIDDLSDDGAARDAGMLEGDRITAIDGEPVSNFGDLVRVVAPRANQRVPVEFERGGRVLTVDVELGATERDGKTVGLLGVISATDASAYYYKRQFGVIDSIGQSLDRTWTSTVFTLQMLGRMLTGDVSIKNISGPINIAQFAGESAQRGVDYYLGFLAIVSISLGVLNLLPVPVLDGGQIVYQLVEAIKGGPLSERAQILGQQIGILALLLLMSFAFYNDIARILG